MITSESQTSLQIKQLLAERFGAEKICDTVNPDEVVAYGASVQAASMSGLTEATLMDVASHSLGMKTIGDVMVSLPGTHRSIECHHREDLLCSIKYIS